MAFGVGLMGTWMTGNEVGNDSFDYNAESRRNMVVVVGTTHRTGGILEANTTHTAIYHSTSK